MKTLIFITALLLSTASFASDSTFAFKDGREDHSADVVRNGKPLFQAYVHYMDADVDQEAACLRKAKAAGVTGKITMLFENDPSQLRTVCSVYRSKE